MHSHSVLHTGEEGGMGVYDAEYVALARQLQVTLVTTDEKLLAQLPLWNSRSRNAAELRVTSRVRHRWLGGMTLFQPPRHKRILR